MRTFPKSALEWALLPTGKNKAQAGEDENAKERGDV